MNWKLLPSVTAVLLSGAIAANATPIAAWDATGTNANCAGFTCGIRFQANEDLEVSALGAFQAAFTTSAQVGLWDAAGTLLRSVTITSADTLLASYYYESVSSLLLTSGSFYTVGVWIDGALGSGGVTPNPTNVSASLSLDSGVFSPFGSGFGFPANEDPRFFAGANFLAEAVPEPSTLGLVGLGLASVGLARRRRGRHSH